MSTGPATSAARPAAELTRVTLVGQVRSADLVLPSGEPLGALLPDILTLTGYGPGGDPRAYQLTTLDGAVLDQDRSLLDCEVADGSLIRVDAVSDAPPQAVVHDVTDVVVGTLGDRPDRWGERARRWTVLAGCLAAGVWAGWTLAPHLPVAATAAAALALLAAGSASAAWARHLAPAIVCAVAPLTAVLVAEQAWSLPWRAAAWCGLAVLTMLLLTWAGRRLRAGVTGATVGLLLVALAVVLWLAAVPTGDAAAVVAIVALLLLGVLPRVALVWSGLTRLDDARAEGEPVTRAAVATALDQAHRGLALGVVAAGSVAVVCGVVLAGEGNGWFTALAWLVAAAMVLRVRACPLTAEVLTLLVGALVVAGSLVHALGEQAPGRWWVPSAAAGVVFVVGVTVLAWRPSRHVRARARQVADRAEQLAVVALIPVAVGGMGVYGQLLERF